MALTKEQNAVVEAILDHKNNKIIAVNSIAGSGKTSTANAVIRAYKPIDGFYTAFNKAIVEDSKNKFGNLINCSTIHSLAYKYIKPSSIEELGFANIKEKVPYNTKTEVIKVLDDFYRSNSVDVYEYVDTYCFDDVVKNLVCEYAEKMLEGSIKPTFNYLLKCLHIMLANGEVSINKDLLVLDECQDTTAVTLEIFKLINADRKIMFGDKFQNIYSFMNTVNAFEELDDLSEIKLTRSFRCSPDIANQVEVYGKQYLENEFIYNGNPSLPSNSTTSICYLSRTNSGLLSRIEQLIKKGSGFSTSRSINTIFEYPLSVVSAASGKELNGKFRYLSNEYNSFIKQKKYKNFYNYLLKEVDVPEVKAAINKIMDLNKRNVNIWDLYKAAKEAPKNPNIILSTAHAFKGLEADTVVFENDLNTCINKSINKFNEIASLNGTKTVKETRNLMSKDDKENLNTYYVALSRARSNLINVHYKE